MRKIAIFSGRGIGDFLTLFNFLFSLSQDKIKSEAHIFLDDTRIFSEFANLFKLKNIKLVEFSKKNFLKKLYEYKDFNFDYIISRYPSHSKVNFFLFFLRGKKLGSTGSFWSRFFDYQIPINEDKKIEENEKLHLDYMGVKYKKFISARQKRSRIITRIGFHLGAREGDKSRLWPVSNWIKLIRYLQEYRSKMKFCFFGSKDEEFIYKELLQNYNHFNFVNYCCKLPLKEAFKKIGGMHLFISTNSGLMHIAAFYGLPQIALCGPSRREWYPHNENAEVIANHNDYFGNKREKQIKNNKKYYVENIPVDKVIKRIKIILDQK